MSVAVVFTNALVVTADEVFDGYVVVENGLIAEVGAGRAPEKGHDLNGDFLMPGLVEIHTDHLEAHFMPRPKVEWNVGSAVLAYDAQIATSGITTVFDSLRIGFADNELRAGMGAKTELLADEIARCAAAGALRADHLTHIRCEVPAEGVSDALERFLESRSVHLLSLMDHTPGQRQFRDLEKYFIYYGGKTGKSEAEMRADVARRQATGGALAAATGRRSWPWPIATAFRSPAMTTQRWMKFGFQFRKASRSPNSRQRSNPPPPRGRRTCIQ